MRVYRVLGRILQGVVTGLVFNEISGPLSVESAMLFAITAVAVAISFEIGQALWTAQRKIAAGNEKPGLKMDLGSIKYLFFSALLAAGIHSEVLDELLKVRSVMLILLPFFAIFMVLFVEIAMKYRRETWGDIFWVSHAHRADRENVLRNIRLFLDTSPRKIPWWVISDYGPAARLLTSIFMWVFNMEMLMKLRDMLVGITVPSDGLIYVFSELLQRESSSIIALMAGIIPILLLVHVLRSFMDYVFVYWKDPDEMTIEEYLERYGVTEPEPNGAESA